MPKNICLKSERRHNFCAPNLPACRAIRIGNGAAMVYCMGDNAANCGYSLRFGSGFFCYHPKQNEIVTRTKAVGTVVE